MVKISLPNGDIKEFQTSVSPLEIAQSISERLAKETIAAKVNNKLIDITTTITTDSKIELITTKSKESLEILRHTTAHIFAQAILRIFPKTKITIGPAIENGFFYDVDLDELKEEDLEKIEKEMQKIISENQPISISYKTPKEALEFFKDNEYKIQIINSILENKLSDDESKEADIEDGKLKFYSQGEFSDICTGPHLPSTGFIKAFKLEKVTKAYWRGDANNKQLFRVYGTAFWKKSEMEEHFKFLEEAKKRDHRTLGKKMKLFMNHEYAPGMAFFLPQGFIIYKELQEFIRNIYKQQNYKEVMTPNMFNLKLWEISGHAAKYAEDMFSLEVENQKFALKPMNCPSHCLIFKNEYRSYKELPLRIADFGALHRNELSGALSGLTRVRKFCQDDAHIFCREDQIEDEIDKALKFVDYVYKDVFKIDYEIELSTKPENAIGTNEIWDKAEQALANAIKRNNKEYEICEGDGAFYGPKIDFRIKDCLNRIHQTATIQLDFNLPERFELKFEGDDGSSHQPVMIHRAVLGSVERFMAIIIEHFAGKFPLWLSPTQIKILNVADRHIPYCNNIKEELEKLNFRVSTDYNNDGIGKKIALSREEEKPNYMLIIGDKDEQENTISIRTRKFENGKNEEITSSLEEFINRIVKERENKEIYY